MIPQDQQHISSVNGDCFAACVASMLDMPRSEVPNFMEAGPGPEWWVALQRWLGERNMWCEVMKIESCNEPGYWIGSGKSPRGDYHHAVVMHGHTFAHDPHPSRDFLDGPPVYCYVIVPARGRSTE